MGGVSEWHGVHREPESTETPNTLWSVVSKVMWDIYQVIQHLRLRKPLIGITARRNTPPTSQTWETFQGISFYWLTSSAFNLQCVLPRKRLYLGRHGGAHPALSARACPTVAPSRANPSHSRKSNNNMRSPRCVSVLWTFMISMNQRYPHPARLGLFPRRLICHGLPTFSDLVWWNALQASWVCSRLWELRPQQFSCVVVFRICICHQTMQPSLFLLFFC